MYINGISFYVYMIYIGKECRPTKIPELSQLIHPTLKAKKKIQ